MRLSYQDVLLIINIYKNQIGDYTNVYLPHQKELARQRRDSSELGAELDSEEIKIKNVPYIFKDFQPDKKNKKEEQKVQEIDFRDKAYSYD